MKLTVLINRAIGNFDVRKSWMLHEWFSFQFWRIEWKIFYKMEIVKTVLDLQNYQNHSDVFAEGTKLKLRANAKASVTQWLCFGNGIMMIIPNGKSERVHQVVRDIHTPVLFIQRDNSYSKSKKSWKCCYTDWKFNLPIWQKGLLVIIMLWEAFFSYWLRNDKGRTWIWKPLRHKTENIGWTKTCGKWKQPFNSELETVNETSISDEWNFNSQEDTQFHSAFFQCFIAQIVTEMRVF